MSFRLIFTGCLVVTRMRSYNPETSGLCASESAYSSPWGDVMTRGKQRTYSNKNKKFITKIVYY